LNPRTNEDISRKPQFKGRISALNCGFINVFSRQVKEMNMELAEEWLAGIPSKYTKKSYKAGIKKFESWFKKPVETLIKSPEATRTVEQFYCHLKEAHNQNTARNQTNAVIQFLKFHGTEIKLRRALGVYRTVPTTRDHRTTISEIQSMAKNSSLKEQIFLEVYLLGLRVSDASTLEWQTFNHLDEEPPVPIQILTKKEGIVCQTFISSEFQELLKRYLPTLDKNNPYLLQSRNKGKNLKPRQIDYILKGLVQRAGINNGTQLFRWHTGRKLVMRTCQELSISVWTAKMLVGKAIPMSDATYLEGANLKNDFIKLNKVLRLFPEPTVSISNQKEMFEAIMEALKALLAERLGIKKLTTSQIEALYEKLKPESDRKVKVKLT
jgi:site-specific recombinase XerD